MEPVPETERMEEFRPSPVPSLRLSNPKSASLTSLDVDVISRPSLTLRRSTDPSPSSPSSPLWATPTSALPYRPRTASPLSGAHSRSRSVTSLTPSISRTQSMPGVNGHGRILYSPQLRPASPSGSPSPSRNRFPRKSIDESFPPPSPVRMSVLEPEQRRSERSSSPGPGFPTSSSARLRPSSPGRNMAHSSTSSIASITSTPSSISSSPSYRPYDGAYGGYVPNLSSVPSTPTSTRSRSPSISSLETIPDSPDAEEAALETERIAQLQSAAEAAEGGDSKARGSLDVPTRGRTLAFGSRDKRKRWSVCGAERRGDIDLETIWED